MHVSANVSFMPHFFLRIRKMRIPRYTGEFSAPDVTSRAYNRETQYPASSAKTQPLNMQKIILYAAGI